MNVVMTGREPADEKHLSLLVRLWRMFFRAETNQPEFTNRLLNSFAAGLPVHHPIASEDWFATLDVIEPIDKQVAALVRLSPFPPKIPKSACIGTTRVEERNRKLFAKSSAEASDDLVLRFTFPVGMSIERNLRMFREFAQNELGRLRAEVSPR